MPLAALADATGTVGAWEADLGTTLSAAASTNGGKIDQWANQKGTSAGSGHLVQATSGNQPVLAIDEGGRKCVRLNFDFNASPLSGVDSPRFMSSTLTPGSFAAGGTYPSTTAVVICARVAWSRSSAGASDQWIWSLHKSTGSDLYMQVENASPRYGLKMNSTSLIDTGSRSIAYDQNRAIYWYRGNGSADTGGTAAWTAGRDHRTFTGSGALTAGGDRDTFCLGVLDPTAPTQSFRMDVYAVWIGSGASNTVGVLAATLADVKAYMQSKWGVAATKTKRVFLITDSLGIQNCTNSQTLARCLKLETSAGVADWEIVADCLAGRKIDSSTDPADDVFTDRILQYRDTSLQFDGVLPAVGVNDLLNESISGATWWGRYQTLLNTIAAGGFTPIPVTLMSHLGGSATSVSNASFATAKDAANVLIRENKSAYASGKISDRAQHPAIGPRYASAVNGGIYDFGSLETSNISTYGGPTHLASLQPIADCDAAAIVAAAGSARSVTWENVRTSDTLRNRNQ